MKHFFIGILLLMSLVAWAQPQGFKYQAVMRDAGGATMVNQNLGVQVSLTEGQNGPMFYREIHKVTTNQYGLFDMTVGGGAILVGDFDAIDWSAGNVWLHIAIDTEAGNNYTLETASELLSVPYALYAGKAGVADSSKAVDQMISNIAYDPATGDFIITEGGYVHSIKMNLALEKDDLTDNNLSDLGDVQVTPQTGDILRWDGTQWVGSQGSDFQQQLAIINNILTITGGNDVSLAPYMDNTDEQQLNFDPATHMLTLSNGGQVDLSSLYNPASPTYNTGLFYDSLTHKLTVTDNGTFFTVDLSVLADDDDADPANELLTGMTLDAGSNELSVSDAGGVYSVDLSAILNKAYNTGFSFDTASKVLTITDAGSTYSVDLSNLSTTYNNPDADPANELQTISKSGNTVTLSNGGGSFTDEVNDADADPANETNTGFQFNSTTNELTITDASGSLSVDLSQLNNQVYNTGLNFNPATGELAITDHAGTHTVDLSSLMNAYNDPDDDPANELQTINKTGNTVTLSNGGGSFTDEVDDADADPNNELQSIAKVGNVVTLSNGGGSFVDEVNDADADPLNELQTLSLSNDTLFLSNGGGSVVLPVSTGNSASLTGTNNYLIKFTPNGTTGGNSQVYDNGTNVGIGTASPAHKLDVRGSASGILTRSFNTHVSGTGLAASGNNITGYTATNGSGIAGNGFSIGVAGFATNNANTAFGGYFWNDNVYAYVGGWNLSNGSFTPYKIIGNGAVSTIVEGVNGDKLTMFTPEAPEVLFQDYGTAELVNGKAVIKLDPNFSKNINVSADHPLKVFITLEGDCKGVYVTNKSDQGFEVVELANGSSNVSFSWMVVATRKNEVYTQPDGTTKKASFDVRFPTAPDMLPIQPVKKGEDK